MRYAFIGGTLRGLELLKALIKNNFIPLKAIVLKEDDHEENISNEIITYLNQHRVENRCCKKVLPEDYIQLQTLSLDFVFVCGWRTIIDVKLNRYLKLGMFAAHDSLLPLYRGFAPLNWAIINGEKETGVTLFKIESGEVDSGKIFGQKKVTILDDDYAFDVYEKITNSTIELYLNFIKDFKNNSLKPVEQNEHNASYTCKRTPEDGRINWDKPANEIYNLIRALAFPYPGAFCKFNGVTYEIRKAKIGNYSNKKYVGKVIGRVILISSEGVEILCGEGTLLILEWKNKMTGEISNPNSEIKSITSTLY